MESYKRLFEEYKDKVIDNYDYWYMSFVLEDVLDDGCETLISGFDEIFHNMYLSKELKDIIENLLDVDNARELLIEFLKLKRITDERILESKYYDEDLVNEIIFEKENNGNNLVETGKVEPININVRIKNQQKILEQIYQYLFEHQYIDCNKELFLNHFLENDYEKIKWLGKVKELCVVVQMFYDNDIICKHHQRGNKVPLIKSHFIHKNSRPFNDKTLHTESSKISNDDSVCPEIRKFFKKLKIEFQIN